MNFAPGENPPSRDFKLNRKDGFASKVDVVGSSKAGRRMYS